MEDEGDNILGAIYEEDDQGDIDDDVEMIDVDEGKVVDVDARSRLRVLGDEENDASASKQEPESRNRRRRANKRKNKRKRGFPGTDIDRFVLDTCRRLKEKKSYMVYTAVGCLGVSALSDIVKEVDAIHACGGQLTADGKRQRTGGGVLWSIIKAREPDAYKKIMKGAKDFEVYYFFDRAEAIQNASCPATTHKAPSPHGCAEECDEEQHPSASSDSSSQIPPVLDSNGQSISEEKRRSMKDRIRVPVSYDDITGEPGDDAKQ